MCLMAIYCQLCGALRLTLESGGEWGHQYLSSNEAKKLLVLEQHCPVPL